MGLWAPSQLVDVIAQTVAVFPPPTRPLLACIRRRVCSALMRQLYKLLQSAGSHQGIVFQVQAKLISALAPLSHAGLLLCWIAPIYLDSWTNQQFVFESVNCFKFPLFEWLHADGIFWERIQDLIPPSKQHRVDHSCPSRSRRWSCRQT